MKFKTEHVDLSTDGRNNRISSPDAAILVWNYNIRMKNSNAHYNPYRVGTQTEGDDASAELSSYSTRWSALTALSTKLPNDESVSVDDDGTILISGSSIIDITTEKSKSSPRGTFQIILAATSNWLGFLTTGSWLCIMMASQLKMQERHFKRGDRKFVKMVGRIESVRVNHAANPDGSRVCTYIVSGSDWGEVFNSSIWFQGETVGSADAAFLPLVNYYNYRLKSQDFFQNTQNKQKNIDTNYTGKTPSFASTLTANPSREPAKAKTKQQKKEEAKRLAAEKELKDKEAAANKQEASARAAPAESPTGQSVFTKETADVETDYEYSLFSGTSDGDSKTGDSENSLGTLLPINLLRHLLRFFGLFVLELDLLDLNGQELKGKDIRNSAIGVNYFLRKPRISLSIPPAMASFLVGEEQKNTIYNFVTEKMQEAKKLHKKIISMDFNSLNFFVKIVGGRISSFDASTTTGEPIPIEARRVLGAKQITDPEELTVLKEKSENFSQYYEKNSYVYANEGRGALVHSFKAVSPQTTLWKVMGQSCFEAINEMYCEIDFPDTDALDIPKFTADNELEEEKVLGEQLKGRAEVPGAPNAKNVVFIRLNAAKGTNDVSKDEQLPIVSGAGYLYFSVSSDFPPNGSGGIRLIAEGSATLPRPIMFKKATEYQSLDMIPAGGGPAHLDKDFNVSAITDGSVYVAQISGASQYFLRYYVTPSNDSSKYKEATLSASFYLSPNVSRSIASTKGKPSSVQGGDKTKSANRPSLKFVKPATAKELEAQKAAKQKGLRGGQVGTFSTVSKKSPSVSVPNAVVLDIPRSVFAPFVVVCRIKPFITRTTGWGLDYQDASQANPLAYARQMASYFQDVARVPIPMETVISIDAGTNINDAANFIHIQLNHALEDHSGGFGGFQTYDLASIERLGVRVIRYQPGVFAIKQANNNKQTGWSPGDMMNAWKYLIREWYGEGHNYLNGRLKIHGIDSYVPVGDNIFLRAEVLDPSLNFNQSNSSAKTFDGQEIRTSNKYFLAHIENVSHSFSLSPNGARTYVTTIDFTRGIFCDQDYINGTPETRQAIESDVASKFLYDDQGQNRHLDGSSLTLDFGSGHTASNETSVVFPKK